MEQRLLRMLQNCGNPRELKRTHLQILVRGLADSDFLLPKLVEVSAAAHSLGYAGQVLRCTQTRNVVAYNNMVKCFAGSRSPAGAFSAYGRMRALGVYPNSFTFTFLLRAMDSGDSSQGGEAVHAQIVRSGCGSSLFVKNTLLAFYSKCSRDLAPARLVFDEMPQRDVVSWNSLIHAYMMRGEMASAVEAFESMPERSIVSWNSIITGLSKVGDMCSAQLMFDRMAVRNIVSGNAMIAGYAAAGDMAAARSIFDRMEQKNNTVSWNAMISGYNENRRFDRALQTFQAMLIDGECPPNEITLIAVASACGHLGSLEHGNWVYSYAKKNDLEISSELGNALVDMFAKCGEMKCAEAVFNQMTMRCVISWTTMIWGLGAHGQSGEALALFEEMSRHGVEPDDVTFIALLSACAHGGLVEEGQRIFRQMAVEFGIEPRIEHYGCMVDLLARAGRAEEAIHFIGSMPLEPNVVVWATLLSSCRWDGGGEQVVESVGRKMAELEPLDPGYQVLLSNSSASIGRWRGVSSIRGAMWQEGVEKLPGCSSIQVGCEVHEFLAKDLRHERELRSMRLCMGLQKS
ncbi:unnamed protein product [Spirodela intermedia]|uniref:Uncharacterized protein n=1 Tax=Spirodela intermedia TaxID=51605 RepID=A0A7I8IQZ2_SPIIN|nr:unnamed protein product [Spirodela intermedia]CAA6660359.1 unnamed protein product [Spirodela intermedia]